MAGVNKALCLLALLALAACAAAGSSRSLLDLERHEDGNDAEEASEAVRDDSDLIDYICGFSVEDISTSSMGAFANVSDPYLAEMLAEQQRVYNWAAPVNEDMEYLCKMMREYNAERDEAAEDGKPHELIFYGDSILQCLRYTSRDCDGATTLYKERYAEKYRSAVWALGGDTAGSLMWRLLNGNGPHEDAKVIVLQVGQQDIMQADQNPDTWDQNMDALVNQIKAICDYLESRTKDAQVLLVSQLPITGYDSKGKPTMEVPDLYADGITRVNDELAKYGMDEKRVSYINCYDKYMDEDDHNGREIEDDYFASTNVPTGRGMYRLADCIEPWVEDYMSRD
jgi:hypothetical protein